MAASTCTPTPSPTPRMQLTAVITVLLFLADCRYFLADASAGAAHRSGERVPSLLQVPVELENWHDWRNLKSQNAKNFDFSAFGASHGRTSTASWGRSLTSRRRATSNDSSETRSRLEVEALTSFKAAITSDPLGALNSWHANDSSVCGWDGVVCSVQQGPEYITALNLSNRQLAGNLNSALEELGTFASLLRLDLSNNSFSGSIPGASLTNFSDLSYLNVSFNQVSGTIPSVLGELVKLEVLDLEGNVLSGEIPVTLGNCSLLRILNLGTNLLEGEIPPALGRLTHLEFLNLEATLQKIALDDQYVGRPPSANSFSGSIPPALGNCSSLTYLAVTYNSNLGGKLPVELSLLNSLQQLRLSLCGFQGTVPTWIGNLTSLSQIRMSYNQFDGEIPAVLGQLPDLKGFSLGGNNLTGEIPLSITNCTGLTTLTVERNSLSGKIPSQLGLLTNLEWLYLALNEFTGVIPPEIANCSALTQLALTNNPMDPQSIPSWMGSFANLIYLYLSEMNLQGEIPKEIGRLSNLQSLEILGNNLRGRIPSFLANCSFLFNVLLSNNEFTGEVPSEIGQLVNLIYIDFSTCSLTGSLPASIANLTQIETIMLNSNSLNGTIDVDFGRLSRLGKFHAEGNHFDGPIPKTLGNCSNLYEVDFSGNKLTGEIPTSLGNLTQLQQLLLGNNEIGGIVPVDILRCSKLGSLGLEFNNLEGSILANIGQLSSLRVLRLAYNRFTGGIPISLGNCSDMSVVDLSYNRLIGDVPGDVFPKMSSLTSLNLSHNFLSGSWPQELSQLTNIQIIDISANNISGFINSSLVNCIALVRLDISINNLTGAIPASLGLLPALSFLNVSYNAFQGPIPDSGVFKANLTNASFMGNPELCGNILGPHRQCIALSSTGNATSHRTCDGFHCKRVWIPTICAAAGFVFVLAAVLCWVNKLKEAKKRDKSRHVMLNFGPRKRFTEKDVLRTIDGDGPGDNVIGLGAKSVVYKGILRGGETFAIKVLSKNYGGHGNVNSSSSHGHTSTELLQEVHILANLRHRNILKVLGVCSTSNVEAIILEYMPQGSLHQHLYPLEGGKCELTWQTRMNIAFGIAEGMTYLHHDFPEPLIHRDLKPSNVLLDANLDPKVSDFGISKFTTRSAEGEATASNICGTVGYMPPEYATGTSISTKGDVYSYGIVLFELLTRKPPTSADKFGPHGNLREWVMETFEEDPTALLDSTLLRENVADSFSKEQMQLMIRLAIFCTRELPRSRPSMSDVLVILTHIKEVQLIPITPKTIQELANDPPSWSIQDAKDVSLSSGS